jgi:tight adherence protein B
MNWPAGMLVALLVVLSMGALVGARRAGRARVALARLSPSVDRVSFRVEPPCMPAVVRGLTRRRRDGRADAALPDVLEAVARGLRSGASLLLALDEAVATAGPLAGDLHRITAEATHGSDLAAALERWSVARPLPGVQLAVSALCLGIEAGGAQARAVDGVAATLRQRHGVAAEARALGAQARMSALVIALAPVVFCALTSTTDARTAHFLLRTTTGQLLLVTGVALDVVGALWMNRLTEIHA